MLACVSTWMNLDGVTQHEMTQLQKDKYCMVFLWGDT